MVEQISKLVVNMAQNIPAAMTKASSGKDFQDMMQKKLEQSKGGDTKQTASKDTSDTAPSQDTQAEASASTHKQQTTDPTQPTEQAQELAQQSAVASMMVQFVPVSDPMQAEGAVMTDGVVQTAAIQPVETVDMTAAEGGQMELSDFGQTTQQQVQTPAPQTPQQTEERTASAADTQTVQLQSTVEQTTDVETQPVAQDSRQDEGASIAAQSSAQPLFQEVEAMPVQVGEVVATVDTGSPDMAERLADALQASLHTVGDTVQIALSPKHLGHITVELTQTAGKISLVVLAEDTRTNSLMAQHAAGLQDLMRERTGQEVQVEVRQQPQQQMFEQDGRNGQQQEQSQQRPHQQSKDEQDSFLNQLRLGLLPTDFLG